MARHITEVTAKGKTYYISYSDLDSEGESNQLFWDTKKGSGMNSMPSKYRLRNGEIVDYNTNSRVSKYDLSEFFANQ